MFKKMLPWLIMILIAITLVTLAAFVLWEYIMRDTDSDPNAKAASVEARQLSAEEISRQTVKIEEITTNLAGNEYVIQISFAFLLTNEKAKTEMETVKHLAESKIIRTLADTAPEDIQGSSGMDALISRLINTINPILKEGKIKQIDITNFIVTEQP